jgi:alkylation response protein AidB-like acyl-CoA dehydrogenase
VELRFSKEDEVFRAEVRDWLEAALAGEFAVVRGRGGPGDEEAVHDERLAWERHLGSAGWIGLGWSKDYGGREESLVRQVIYNEEYARAGAPGRLGHIGETLLGPTLIAFGTEQQKSRFLPPILRGEELWCAGLLRAERRQRPGRRRTGRGSRRRRLGHRRPEDVDLLRALVGLVLRALPDRPRGAAPQGL